MARHFRFAPTFLLLIAAPLGLALPAAAEAARTPAAISEHYSYEFETDFVDGNDLDGDGPRISVRPLLPRVMLIRPRTSFVLELLHSGENL